MVLGRTSSAVPAPHTAGSVRLEALSGGKRTRVTLALRHAVPHMLIEMGVGVFGIQGSVGPILKENLADLKVRPTPPQSSPVPRGSWGGPGPGRGGSLQGGTA